jgi:UPF0176 protein
MTIAGPITVAALYAFRPLEALAELQTGLKQACLPLGVRGIILLAPEGINATIAAPGEALQAALALIRSLTGIDDLNLKFSFAEQPPFKRFKVRLKKEIVTLGDLSVDPNRQVGHYVAPEDWNALIADPDVTVIDTRNSYEVALGRFDGALDPATRSFGQFPDYVRQTLDPARHKKIAMYCTGGIRCEKASSYMLSQGFEEVYHLKGGILSYLEQVAAEDSRWQGGCFVFDERVAVGHGLVPLPIRLCISCDNAVDEEARASPDFEEGVSCPHCRHTLSAQQLASARERQKQMLLAGAKA